jgi:PEP-CTERM motif
MKRLMTFAMIGLLGVAFRTYADENTKISQVNTALSNTTFGGYVDVAETFNPDSPIQFSPATFMDGNFNSEIQPVPEPSSLALLALGFTAVGWIAKIRRQPAFKSSFRSRLGCFILLKPFPR